LWFKYSIRTHESSCITLEVHHPNKGSAADHKISKLFVTGRPEYRFFESEHVDRVPWYISVPDLNLILQKNPIIEQSSVTHIYITWNYNFWTHCSNVLVATKVFEFSRTTKRCILRLLLSSELMWSIFGSWRMWMVHISFDFETVMDWKIFQICEESQVERYKNVGKKCKS